MKVFLKNYGWPMVAPTDLLALLVNQNVGVPTHSFVVALKNSTTKLWVRYRRTMERIVEALVSLE